jgi:hypothetical protein
MREFEASFEQGVESFLQVYPTVHRAGASGVERPVSRGRLPAARQAAQEVRGQARDPAHPVRKRLPRPDVGRGAGARCPRDRRQCPAVPDARDRRPLEAAQGSGLAHGGSAERAGVALPRHAGHERLRPGGVAASPERQWRRGAEPLCGADRQRLCGFTAQDLKKHDLLRVAAATDAAEIVAEDR